MIQECVSKCERCGGTGQVYAYKDKPLHCSPNTGRFLREKYRTNDDFLREKCGNDTLGKLHIALALFEEADWGTLTCPDCEGQGKWVYTLEQLPPKVPEASEEPQN